MASNTSYSSNINLNLGQVPTTIQDQTVYKALLDIHNALEVLSQYADTDAGIDVGAYVAKMLGFVAVEDDYIVKASDAATILVSTTGGDITITLPSTADLDITGYVYQIKHVAGTGTVYVQGEGSSTIDGDSYELDLYDAIPVKCDGANWYVYQ